MRQEGGRQGGGRRRRGGRKRKKGRGGKERETAAGSGKSSGRNKENKVPPLGSRAARRGKDFILVSFFFLSAFDGSK